MHHDGRRQLPSLCLKPNGNEQPLWTLTGTLEESTIRNGVRGSSVASNFFGDAMRVLVDGYNRVATYARNLTCCLQREGHDVSVLYGVRGAPDKTHLMREVSFFDNAAGGKRGHIRLVAEALLSPLSRSAYEVKLSGAVIYRQFASTLPHHDTLWNSPDIFELAHRRFRFHRKRLTVRTPKNISVAHWTYPLPIKHETARNVYTLHDLVPLRLPYTTLDNKNYYYKLVRLIAHKADHIVTVSETSKKDIVNLLGIDADRVTNTYQSVDIPPEYLGLKEDILRSNLSGSFGLEYKSYLLFFGSIEPKKNVGRILEAYLAANIEMPLVIVGAQAWCSNREQQILTALGSQVALGGQKIPPQSSAPRLRVVPIANYSNQRCASGGLSFSLRGVRASDIGGYAMRDSCDNIEPWLHARSRR